EGFRQRSTGNSAQSDRSRHRFLQPLMWPRPYDELHQRYTQQLDLQLLSVYGYANFSTGARYLQSKVFLLPVWMTAMLLFSCTIQSSQQCNSLCQYCAQLPCKISSV